MPTAASADYRKSAEGNRRLFVAANRLHDESDVIVISVCRKYWRTSASRAQIQGGRTRCFFNVRS